MYPLEPCQLMINRPEAIAHEVIDDRCIFITNAILEVCYVAISCKLFSRCSSLKSGCYLILIEHLIIVTHHSEHSYLDQDTIKLVQVFGNRHLAISSGLLPFEIHSDLLV